MASIANKFAAAAKASVLKEAMDKAGAAKTPPSSYGVKVSGGGSAESNGTSVYSGNKSPSGGYTVKYTGGNAALDAALAKHSAAYSDARKRALAGDQSAVTAMREANDAANQLRNQYGYAAEYADDDINNVKKQINYYGPSGKDMMGVGYGERPGSGTVTQPAPAAPASPATPSGGTGSAAPVDDMSNYLEEMYAAKKRNAMAQLDAAYQKNVSALDAAKGNLAPGYRDARNQAAANSARSGRNFAEYAAASGLNSGAKGQAELARNVSLQNDLGAIDRQEVQSLSDLELQRAQMESEYNAAIAQAEASGDYELAASLYEEKVRQSEAALQQQMLAYQKERDAISDQQWKQQFDFNVGQAGTAEKQWQAEMDYKNNAYLDQQQNANRSQMAEYGSYFLKNGAMPSQEMLDAMGITAADAQSFIDRLSLNASAKAAGSGGTGTSGSAKPSLTWPQTLAEIEKGNLTANVLSAYQYYMGQDYTAGKGSASPTEPGTEPSPNYGFQALVSQLSELEDRLNPSAVPTRAAALIRSAYENGSITENAAKRLLSQYGMN